MVPLSTIALWARHVFLFVMGNGEEILNTNIEILNKFKSQNGKSRKYRLGQVGQLGQV
jgi:hypothetical protein